jgi:hypothetical protein
MPKGIKGFQKGHKIQSPYKFPKGNTFGGDYWRGKKHTKKSLQKMSKSQKGNRNNWRGGIFTDYRGYVRIFTKTHPYRGKNNYVSQHRLVMEAHIGRYLEHKEQVHHINNIRNDNRIENLKIVTCSEHNKIHKRFAGLKRNKLGQFIKKH